MFNDPVADLLAQIKNGYLAKIKTVTISHSKMKYNLALVLQDIGFLTHIKEVSIQKRKYIEMTLIYKDRQAVLTDVIKVSKPGLRVYTPYNKIQRVLSGLGSMIISTPKGLMTGKKAREQKLGGEIICKIW